jgi:glucan phosphoethanolaminetransferase (alkaline phosphatase superfamily)
MTTVRIENSASSSRTSADYLALRSVGAVYVMAWVVGLLVAPSAPSQTAPDIKVQAFFQQHHTATLIQAVLVHGVAGVAFAAFVVALAGSRLVPRSGSARALLLVAGLAAAAVSLAQVGLEVAINRHVAGSGSASTTASLFHAVNIADTVKLVLLGVAIAAATRAMQEAGAVRGWVQGLGYALLPILVIGGLAFVVHSDVLSGVLDLSLLLLLLWVGAISVLAPRLKGVTASP